MVGTRHLAAASAALGLAVLGGPAIGAGPRPAPPGGQIESEVEARGDAAAPAIAPAGARGGAGPVGRYDPTQLRRGYQVYKQVCSNCHAMKFVAFRSLADIGYDPAEVRAVAASYQVDGGIDDRGAPVKRPGRPSDTFPSALPSEATAVAAFGAVPPDMSSLAEARSFERPFPLFLLDLLTGREEAEGADYIRAVLNGYTRADDPNYNVYVPDHRIAMPKPLSDGQVVGPDGTPQTLAQASTDVAAFLMWAADPKLDRRKTLGVGALSFLLVFATLLYFVKRRIWARVGGDAVVGAR